MTERVSTKISVVAVAATIAAAACGPKAKETEAERNLKAISKGIEAKFARTGAIPVGRVGPTPPIGCCEAADHQCGGDPTAWQLPLWQELGFAIPGKHVFVYSYEGSATGYTISATGDLDCDDKTATYTLTGTVEGKKVVTKLDKPLTPE